ncbi:DUF397 domain-containing protein [Streptomyces huiliensis]|uniref:DUF397 domain-containing protein n=1 Tax=Streptomyces huiliensis TaxID=2876027 RepID=UPI001CC16F2E|nr:DUF397 domain-containing protein [Streptomyces huiliensis]MBZ4320091.1 DUF397 domain-containing protein [Streptomyces huiliensis]
MPGTDWQRSSFCGGGGNNCVEARLVNDAVHLRESSEPDTVVAMTREQLAAFVAGVKAGEFDHLL